VSGDDDLYVDEDGYQKVVDQVHQIRELLSPLTAKISDKQNAGIDVLCDQSVAGAVAQVQSALSGENALNVSALDEVARKMKESLSRYRATDGNGAMKIDGSTDMTVQQAASTEGG
jgi:hypothetical protein